jgi:hypothetical protein
MLKAIGLTRAILLLLSVVGVGLCQEHNSASLSKGPASARMQRPEISSWGTLPDAPSPVRQTGISLRFTVPASGSLTFGTGTASRGIREMEPTSGRAGMFILRQGQFGERESKDLLSKYLYPRQVVKHDRNDDDSASGSLLRRASNAASRAFITRDDSGKIRPNTSSVLDALTVAIVHTAYHPYWARSSSATFSDFRSTIGGDAGINVFHEFEPDIQHLVRGFTPKFVVKLEQRLIHNYAQKASSPVSAR